MLIYIIFTQGSNQYWLVTHVCHIVYSSSIRLFTFLTSNKKKVNQNLLRYTSIAFIIWKPYKLFTIVNILFCVYVCCYIEYTMFTQFIRVVTLLSRNNKVFMDFSLFRRFFVCAGCSLPWKWNFRWFFLFLLHFIQRKNLMKECSNVKWLHVCNLICFHFFLFV